jgi:hypothetical protein
MLFTYRTHDATLCLTHKTHYCVAFWSLQFSSHFAEIQLDISLRNLRGEFPLAI